MAQCSVLRTVVLKLKGDVVNDDDDYSMIDEIMYLVTVVFLVADDDYFCRWHSWVCLGDDMNTEEDEFKRIEREALRRAAQDDDDTQGYVSEFPLPNERNFCPRCGKRTADLTAIHTCTLPQENT